VAGAVSPKSKTSRSNDVNSSVVVASGSDTTSPTTRVGNAGRPATKLDNATPESTNEAATANATTVATTSATAALTVTAAAATTTGTTGRTTGSATAASGGQISQPDTASTPSANGAAPANVQGAGVAQTDAASPPAKTPRRDGKSDADDDTSTTDAATTTTASQTEAASTPAPPVAAAVVVADAAVSTPSPANATSTAIGDATNGRAKSTVAYVSGQDAPAKHDATDDAAGKGAKPTSPGMQTDNTAYTAKASPSDSSDGDAKIQTPSRASASQAQTQTSDDASAPAQTDGSVPVADRGTQTAANLPAISSPGTTADASNAQSTAVVAKVDATGLPNFGFSAANMTATPATDAAPTSSAAASTPTVSIAGLAVAIAARAQTGSHQFDIRLDPPELGRIDVRLDVDHNGQVTTHMTADRSDTLQLLQSQQPHLERALEQAGLKTADNSLQFTLRDQSFTGQQNGSNSQQNGAAQLVIPDPNLAPVTATQIYARASVGSGIDIRV